MKDQRAAAQSLQDRQAAERFAEQLGTLRTSVGDPSFRKMAGRSGRISHTTLHEAAAGTRFPSWETVREFVRACEADEAQWRRRWEDAQRPASVHGSEDGDTAPAGTDSPTGADTQITTGEMKSDTGTRRPGDERARRVRRYRAVAGASRTRCGTLTFRRPTRTSRGTAAPVAVARRRRRGPGGGDGRRAGHHRPRPVVPGRLRHRGGVVHTARVAVSVGVLGRR